RFAQAPRPISQIPTQDALQAPPARVEAEGALELGLIRAAVNGGERDRVTLAFKVGEVAKSLSIRLQIEDMNEVPVGAERGESETQLCLDAETGEVFHH